MITSNFGEARKASQMTEISVKILKGNADIFSVYICNF